MTHRYSKYRKEINIIGDIVFLNVTYFLVYFFSIGEFDTLFRSIYFELQLYFNIAWIASSYFVKVHDTSRIASIERVIRKLLNALGLFLILIFAFLGIKEGSYYKLFVFYAYCSTSFGLVVFNIGFVLFLKYYRSVGYNYRNVIIVGYGKISSDLRKYFTYNPELGYRFMGYFDNNSANSVIRGQVSDVSNIFRTLQIDEIYCVLPYLDYHEVKDLTKFAEDNFIKIHAIPDYRGFPYKNIEVQIYDLIPVLKFPAQPLDDQINRFIKRTFDVVFSLLFIFTVFH
jgi:putative colanic acid biosynthesis UDP-glucose lipid carrier transferase